jgi:hypothetical protein
MVSTAAQNSAVGHATATIGFVKDAATSMSAGVLQEVPLKVSAFP